MSLDLAYVHAFASSELWPPSPSHQLVLVAAGPNMLVLLILILGWGLMLGHAGGLELVPLSNSGLVDGTSWLAARGSSDWHFAQMVVRARWDRAWGRAHRGCAFGHSDVPIATSNSDVLVPRLKNKRRQNEDAPNCGHSIFSRAGITTNIGRCNNTMNVELDQAHVVCAAVRG